MAVAPVNEIPTDDPFIQYVSPLEVSTAIQAAISALWLALPTGQRSHFALEQSAVRTFEAVETWWLKLDQRTGIGIITATREAFGPSTSALAEASRGTLRMETMVAWIPSTSLAEALFTAWLLQPEQDRTPSGTAGLVRRVLERQIRGAAADIADFAGERR